eukprot:403332158
MEHLQPLQKQKTLNDDVQSVPSQDQPSDDKFKINLLEYERHILQDLNQNKNSLLVLARGFSVAKQVANFLMQYRKTFDCGNNVHSSPFLIFLINFSDSDYQAIEYYLQQCTYDGTNPLMMTRIAPSDSLTNKRIDMYLKGGVFSVSYKAIVLDLLTKRLSPSIISGFIINNAHKVQENSQESFLCKILRKDNPDNAFIKCISDNPSLIARGGGIFGIENLMKILQVNNLYIYQRIKKSIKDSIDNVKQIKVIENGLKFTKRMDEMHTILIELLAACLEELKGQIKKFDNLSGEPDEVLDPQKALLKSFEGLFRGMMGKNYVYLGQKANQLIQNIRDIKKLMWLLLNQDCVNFYYNLNDLRTNENANNFSIFKYSDEETTNNIERLHKLAKERIMQTIMKQNDESDHENDQDQDQDSDVIQKSGQKQGKKKKHKSTLDNDYGRLNEKYNNWWLMFQERARNIDNLQQYERDYDFVVNFEQAPKFQDYETFQLKRLHKNIKKKSKSKKLEDELYGKQAEASLKQKEELRQAQNRNILIPVKVSKTQADIQRFLINHFVKSDQGRSFYEEKLKFHLSSHSERQKRQSIVSQSKQCNQAIIEAYFTHKLSIHLEQKFEWQYNKCNRYNSNGQTFKDSKKRPRNEMSGQDNQNIQLNYQNSNLSEDVIQEIEEGNFRPQNIINGYNVHVLQIQNNSDFELALRNLDPKIVVLYEPQLEFMRAIEIYNAERVKFHEDPDSLDQIEVNFMIFEESAEYYQYMNNVEVEKKGFQKLMDIKPKLYIELKDFKLENEVKLLEKRDRMGNDRKGGYKALTDQNISEIDRDIIAVDSREFSSTTPIYLYEKGFWLIPLVMTVGDYVISDEICIERKAVKTGDLFESFKSGRLLNQITNMARFYKKPMLLIEFEESIPFKLTDKNVFDSTAGGEVNPANIISKISLLTLHFPTLQILWSKGPQHTADIFKELKRTQTGLQKDPDLQKIARIGKVGDLSGDADLLEENNEDDEFNRFMPTEFLKKLPGIDSNNINMLTSKVRNMVDLCQLDEDELKKIINHRNAKELKAFLSRKVDVVKNNDETEDL